MGSEMCIRDRYREDWIDQCADSVIRSLEIDQNDHEAHRIMGAISLVRGDFELARHHQERAMELCPSDAYIMGKNAALLVYLGEPEKALEIVQHAMRIYPFVPMTCLSTNECVISGWENTVRP